MLTWSYGVTTCKGRIDTLLPKTLRSLAAAGFPKPEIFIDGLRSAPSSLDGYRVTLHSRPLQTFGNWVTTLWSLYLRDAHADRFAIFQDDIVAYPHLREFLDTCDYPSRGYWNLYTFPENTRDREGWHKTKQAGKGALGLVFDVESVRTLLGRPAFVRRPMSLNPKKPPYKCIDGAVVDALSSAGVYEYCHTPSLLQHTGDVSSLGHVNPKAPTFRGVDYDARKMIKPKASRVVKRIGLVGFDAPTGLGELNRQIATYAPIDRWLVKPHPKYGTPRRYHPDVDPTACPNGRKLERWLSKVDAVVFCETPYYEELLSACRRRGIRSVLVPMHEWLTPGAKGWPEAVDVIACPTRYAYDQLKHLEYLRDVRLFDWPVDTERFKFRPRSRVDRFLFLNGGGGFSGRKGAACVRDALSLWPDMPITIIDQRGAKEWPLGPNVRVSGPAKSNADLFSEGDVLVSPHSVDGLGLEPMEAMACGMPVVTTDGRPWNENPAIARIAAKKEKRTVRRSVDWYTPDPADLVAKLRGLLGRDISQESESVREWAESRSWGSKASEFEKILRG